MDSKSASEYTQTDPNLGTEEKQFSVAFTKKDSKADIYTSIASQVKRCLNHSDIEEIEITVYNEDKDTYKRTTTEEFDGNGIITAFKGTVPIESLKIQSNPRSSRSYAQIISQQTEVNIQ